MENAIRHFEIHGRDGERSRRFYAELFDWKIDANNPMNYGLIGPEPTVMGGGIAHSPAAAPFVTIYVEVPDLHATLARAGALGGKTVLEPTAVPNGPEIAQFADLDGNVIGLMKAIG